MKTVVFFPISRSNVGVLFHFVDLCIELYSLSLKFVNIEVVFLAETGEQNPGLLDKLYSRVPESSIIILNDQREFSRYVFYFLLNNPCCRVVYLSQGMKQFLYSVPVKRRFPNRFYLYHRLNSFKHGSWMRYVIDFPYTILLMLYSDYVNPQTLSTLKLLPLLDFLQRFVNIRLIPLGLNVELDISPPDSWWLRTFDHSETINLIYLAEFHAHKRQIELIHSVAPVLDENPHIRLFLFGDGVKKRSAINVVEKLNLSSQILFPGRVDRQYIPWILRRSSCAFVLSSAETFGHNILEPLFYGLPVISSRVGISEEVITNGVSGFVFDGKLSTHQLKYFLSYLLDEDEAKKLKFRKSVNDLRLKYSWNNIAREYFKLFVEIRDGN